MITQKNYRIIGIGFICLSVLAMFISIWDANNSRIKKEAEITTLKEQVKRYQYIITVMESKRRIDSLNTAVNAREEAIKELSERVENSKDKVKTLDSLIKYYEKRVIIYTDPNTLF